MEKKRNKADQMLSLAAKAGKVVSGETAVENAVRSGKVYLVVLAGDASDNTRHKFLNKSRFYGIPIYQYSTKEELAHAIGKDLRSVLAITEENMAGAIQEKLEEMDVHGENKDL